MNVTSNEQKLFDENGCIEKLEFSLCSWYFPKPISLQNLYISYGHNFSMESNIEIMYWNLSAHKTLDIRIPENWPFLLNYL